MSDYSQVGWRCKGCGKTCYSKTQQCGDCKPRRTFDGHSEKNRKLGLIPHMRKCEMCPVLFLVSIDEQMKRVWKCPDCRQKRQMSKAS